MLKPAVARAVAAVKAGRHFLVANRFHRATARDAPCAAELPARRSASRSNSFGVTLVRVLARKVATISGSGFYALDGSPILDVRPSPALSDAPSVASQQDQP